MCKLRLVLGLTMASGSCLIITAILTSFKTTAVGRASGLGPTRLVGLADLLALSALSRLATLRSFGSPIMSRNTLLVLMLQSIATRQQCHAIPIAHACLNLTQITVYGFQKHEGMATLIG